MIMIMIATMTMAMTVTNDKVKTELILPTAHAYSTWTFKLLMSNEIYNTENLIYGWLLNKKMKFATLCSASYITINFSRLPVHGPLLQVFVSVLGPEQFAPPPDGGGLVQVRERSLVPSPQVTLHSPNSPQSLHPPLTIAVRMNW